MPPIRISGIELLSIDELVAAFPAKSRPSRETIRRYIQRGRLRGRKVGGSWYVSAAALADFFRAGTPAPAIATHEPERPPVWKRPRGKSFRPKIRD